MPSTTAVGQTTTYAYTSSSSMLQRGSSGPQVLALQKALLALGFNPRGLDGKFGAYTEAALKAFQKAAHITVDGKAGPQTWGAINARLNGSKPTTTTSGGTAPKAPTLKPGAKGDFVKWMQALLKNHGYNPGPVDGQYGPMTLKAVSAFQKAHGLAGSGTVGPITWGLLSKAPSGTAPVPGSTGPVSGGIAGMLNWARSMIGSKYAAVNPFRFGEVLWDGKPHTSVNGSGTVYNYPKGTRVFDCSGFVVAAYRKLGIDLAAHGCFSTGTMQASSFLQTVSQSQLRPGDLIFYKPHNGIGHVVIYAGNGQCIECAGGVGVVARTVDWSRVQSYRRVPGT